ncbi:sucrase ferredoxin [Brachybacterium sp. UNK5269]|uniref:sucrase ferredoxin n=1 Tax=Brachybacterium sp. UNK5269 TaxID=3408576 RepID=UPI003BB0C19A
MTSPAPAEWAPCSDRSRERGDALGATGGLGRRWLLVEIDGPWGPHAFLDSILDRELGRAIAVRAERAGLRPVAIRRFGLRADQRRERTTMRWAIADSRPGREEIRWGTVEDPAQLLELPLDGSAGEPSDRPALLVCTHARHDQCCAVRGRPVAAALAEAYPEETWECSHLGGDRFAATMILLPHGLYYGRVPAESAPDIVAAYQRGLLVPEHFRGRSAISLAAQAAEDHARVQLGDHRLDAFTVLAEQPGTGEEPTTVHLRHGADGLVVRLRESWTEPLLSTCGARRAFPVRRYEAVSMQVRPGQGGWAPSGSGVGQG